MGRTALRVIPTGSIALLFALTSAAGAAVPAAGDAAIRPSAAPIASPLASDAPVPKPPADERWSWRAFVELIVLAAACAAVVAFYSMMPGERGGTRVPARVRRR